MEGDLKDLEQQNIVTIKVEMAKIRLRKTSNWKSPGPDEWQGCLSKNFTAVKRMLVRQLDEHLPQEFAGVDELGEDRSYHKRQ